MVTDVKEVLEKSNRYLRLKNVHGKSVCVVREVYRREVVPCQSQLCLSGCPTDTGNSLSECMRKPSFFGTDQVRHKLACTVTEDG